MVAHDGSKSSKTLPIVSLLSGGIAGGVEATATYPMEFAKTRVQLRNERGVPSPRNPFSVPLEVIRTEGVRALYKGCSVMIVGSIAKDGVRFLCFDTIKHQLADKETGALTPARSMVSGMLTGVVASVTCITPTERIKTALIDDARNEKRFRNPIHAIRLIIAESGLMGLYRGLAGTTLKQAGATAFRMGTYNILKDYEKKHDIEQNTATNFANGAVAGTITTLATQPFDVIKTRAQSAHGASTAEAVRSVLVDEGIRGFWRGTIMRLGRTIVAGGILFTTAEKAASLLNPVFVKAEEKLGMVAEDS